MADLIAIVFESEAKAEEVRSRVLAMTKEYLIDIGDAAIAVKTDTGKVKLNQLMNMTAAGAAGGSFWGLLIGVLFLNPLLGVAAGAAGGAIGGALTDVGVNDRFMKDLAAEDIQPGEAVLFVDCEAAFYRTSVPRAVAQMLQLAGFEFGLMREQWCCGGPAAEMGYVEQAKRFARHNLDDWRAVGVKRVIVLDPHDYIAFTEDYPKYFGEEFDDIEIVLAVELFAELIREGRLAPSVPIERAITYHDPCRLNKRKGIWQEPREILRAIPGLDFRDVDRVTQWSYCSGGGGGLPVEKPELTAKISDRRLEHAAELEVDTLVSACPWSERPLAEAGGRRAIDVVDIHELLAESLGIEVGGSRGE